MSMQPTSLDQQQDIPTPKRHAVADLSLWNFRHTTQFSIETEGKPVLLSGHNGAGKTNILEAVSLLSPGRGVRQASAEQFLNRHVSARVGWQIASRLHDAGGNGYLVKTQWQAGQNSRTVSLEDERVSQQVLAEYCRAIGFGPRDDQLFVSGADAVRRFFDRLVVVFDPAHANRVQSMRQLQRQRRQVLESGVTDTSWRRAIEKQLAAKMVVISASRAQHAHALARVCRERVPDFVVHGVGRGAAWGVALQGGIQHLLAEHSALAVEEEIAARLHAEHLRAENTGIQDIWSVHLHTGAGKDEVVPVAQLSHGQQKLAILALLLAQAWLMSEDLGVTPIVLLDEGLSHLDAQHREVLFAHLRSLQCQFWLSGIDVARYLDWLPEAQSVTLSTLKE